MSAINSWRVMWTLVAFDTPTKTAADRKRYTQFRKRLLEMNFTQLQFSVYLRHCPTFPAAQAMADRVAAAAPPKAHVVCFFLTDKQYGMTHEHFGRERTPKMPPKPLQAELF